jgi:hypothetical protein
MAKGGGICRPCAGDFKGKHLIIIFGKSEVQFPPPPLFPKKFLFTFFFHTRQGVGAKEREFFASLKELDDRIAPPNFTGRNQEIG